MLPHFLIKMKPNEMWVMWLILQTDCRLLISVIVIFGNPLTNNVLIYLTFWHIKYGSRKILYSEKL